MVMMVNHTMNDRPNVPLTYLYDHIQEGYGIFEQFHNGRGFVRYYLKTLLRLLDWVMLLAGERISPPTSD